MTASHAVHETAACNTDRICFPERRKGADRIRFPGRRESVRGAFGQIIPDLHAPENELRPA
jgi:hypothetical protein